MKILHVISDRNIGGAGILLLNLLSCFEQKEVISSVALPEDSALTEALKAMQIPVLPLRYSCERASVLSVREIATLIRESGAELVHANAAISARIAGRMCGIPVVHTRHCCFPVNKIFKIGGIRALSGAINNFLSDRVIATAEAAKENLTELGVSSKKIDVVINGSREIRNVNELELEEIRKALNLSPSDFIVGICARLEECKGHSTFLDAAKLVLDGDTQHTFRFLIIGDGSMRKKLEEKAARLGISDAVRFVGFTKDPAPYYRLMRINVNCSIGTETSCLALSEGMSAFVPMIASDYGGNRAMLGEGEAGFLIPPQSASTLAKCISTIAADPVLELKMRSASRERFDKYYTAERMAREVTRIYRELLCENQRR